MSHRPLVPKVVAVGCMAVGCVAHTPEPPLVQSDTLTLLWYTLRHTLEVLEVQYSSK